METDAPTTAPEVDEGDRRKMLGIVAVALVVIVVLFLVLSGGDDDDTTTGDAEPTTDESTDAETTDAGDAETEPEEAATESESEPEEEAAEPEPEPEPEEEAAEPEPETVVVGQDEDGNDIVIELEVTGGCAQTFHEPLDENSFSFIRWSYDAPGLEPGLPIRVSNEAGFEFFTVVTPDRKIVVEQGITAYGEYPFPSLDWNETDDVSVSIDPTQDHTVDDAEGEASETCLEEA